MSEATGQPYRVDHFSHLFAQVREMSGVRADLQYRDLRRTAVVRLARVGCTTSQIAAITGHTLVSANQILEVYLPPDSTVARKVRNSIRHEGRTKWQKRQIRIGDEWQKWRARRHSNSQPSDP